MVFLKVDYSTDKPEVDGSRILFPISAPFYGYLKLLKLHKLEKSRGKDVRSGDRAWGLLHKGLSLTYCAIFTTYMAWLPPRQGLLLVVTDVAVYDFLSCCDCPNGITPRSCVNYLA